LEIAKDYFSGGEGLTLARQAELSRQRMAGAALRRAERADQRGDGRCRCKRTRDRGLAPVMINELFDVLADLRDEGITILLVDQMAVLALAVADRGYVIDSGQIMREDSAANLASDPEVEAAYLGHVEAAQWAIRCRSI
jgi:hypothetical protein